MKKLLTLIVVMLRVQMGIAQISSFPYNEGFEGTFATGINTEFIPEWTGNEVNYNSRIFSDSLYSHTGQRALGIIPTSGFNPEVIVSLNLSGISNLTLNFWAKSELNGVGDRQAIVYFSTSIDGGVTYGPATQIGDSTTFPNASTAYQNYTYPFAFNTFNQPVVYLKINVTRGNGISGGTAARWIMDDAAFAASGVDVTPPTATDAAAVNQSKVEVIFSEPLGISAENISNYSGIPNLSSAIRTGSNDRVELNFSSPLTEGQIYTLSISNVADIAGNPLTVTQSFPVVFNDNTGNVKITEIMYNNPGNDSLEFLEIRNLDSQSINIGGWHYVDGIEGTFPSGTIINPGQYIISSKYKSVVDAFFGVNSYEWGNTYSLNNAGENVSLYNAQGSLIDSVSYDDVIPWDSLANGFGHSLTLCNESADNNQPQNWTHSYDFRGMFFGGTTTDSVFASAGGPCITVGINENNENSAAFIVFPNPANDFIKIRWNSDLNISGKLMITDLTGRIINIEPIELINGSNEHELNITTLAIGSYIFTLETINGKMSKLFSKN